MKKRYCSFLSVLLLILATSASASSYDQSSPTATVQSFILAMLRGDGKAFAQLTKDVMPWYYFESDLLEFANEEMAQSALSDYFYYESDNSTIVLYNSQNTPSPQNEDFFCMQLVRADGKYYINELRLPRHSRGVYSNTWNERCDTAMQSEGKCLAYAQMAADAKDKSSIQENTEGFELSGTILTKYTGTASSVSIPDGVTGIWNYAFSQNTVLKSVIIPNSVTAIGEFAFYDCSALESVQFPSAMTSIAQSAFYKCTSLRTITLPYGIENISSSLFYGCSALQDVAIPTSVTRINSGAFSNCRSLETIAIPESVTYIESGAFDAGFGLTLKVVAGSKAERFARDYWFDYEYYTPEVQVNRPIPSKEQQNQSVFEYDQSSRVSTAEAFMWAMLNGDTKALTTLTKDIIPWYYFESDLLEHGTNVMSGSEMTDFCYFESDENTLLLYDKRVTPSPDIMDFYCMDFVMANGKYYISELRLPHHSRGAYGYKWDERCKAVLNGVGNTFSGVGIKQLNENSSSYTENNDGYQYVETEKPQLSAPKMIAPEKQYGGVFSISGSIQVKWTAVEGATQYKIYIKDVTDIPETQWNDPETDAPSVFKDGVYVYKSPSIENNVVSLDIKQQVDFTMGHTYKGCIMASDDGIHYRDSEGPVFFFSVGTEKEIISLFDIQLTQANNNLTAYMNSTVTAKWTIPEQKQVTDYVLDGYLVELFVTDYAMKDLYAQTIVDNSVDSFAVKLSDWQRVDGSLGIAETKKGKNPYLFSVTPIIVKPDGNKVLGKASAFNLTVYAAKNVDEPKGLDVKGKWIPWSGWVIDPNADKDITASWNTYKGNGHKLRLIWNKKGGNRLGDYSVSKKVAGYNLEKDKLEGEGTYLARLYAVYSESLYDGCVYTYVESKPVSKEFKVGAWSGSTEESEGIDKRIPLLPFMPITTDEYIFDTDDVWESDLVDLKNNNDAQLALSEVISDNAVAIANYDIVIVFLEGYGENTESGRSSAMCVVTVKGENGGRLIRFSANDCSTYPDSPTTHQLNGGATYYKTPTLIDGVYAVGACQHPKTGGYPSMTVLNDRLIRIVSNSKLDEYGQYKYESDSNAGSINIHMKGIESATANTHNSDGCLIIGSSIGFSRDNPSHSSDEGNPYTRMMYILGMADDTDKDGYANINDGIANKLSKKDKVEENTGICTIVNRSKGFENVPSFHTMLIKAYTPKGGKLQYKALGQIMGIDLDATGNIADSIASLSPNVESDDNSSQLPTIDRIAEEFTNYEGRYAYMYTDGDKQDGNPSDNPGKGYWTVGIGHLIGDELRLPDSETAKQQLITDLISAGLGKSEADLRERGVITDFVYAGKSVYKISDNAISALFEHFVKGYVDNVEEFIADNHATNVTIGMRLALYSLEYIFPGWQSANADKDYKYALAQYLSSSQDWSKLDPQKFAHAIARYHTSDGTHMVGLYRRHMDETKLFFTGSRLDTAGREIVWSIPIWWESCKQNHLEWTDDPKHSDWMPSELVQYLAD